MPDVAAIVGGGPAGLMAAEILASAGFAVRVFEAMPTPGRKFLRAGVGGLNLTHAEPLDAFLGRYGAARSVLEPILRDFDADAVRAWADGLGAATFAGSSGRVFPKAMKAAPLLRAWLGRLRDLGVDIRTRHRWTGWDADGALTFATPDGPASCAAAATVLALGGPSWPRLSGGATWSPALAAKGVPLAAWKPANCGFDIAWSETFRDRFAGAPLATVGLAFGGVRLRGQAAISASGIEGGGVYALSAALRDAIAAEGRAVLEIDLAPDRSAAELAHALSRPRGAKTFTVHLRRTCGLDGVRAGLLRETFPACAEASPAAVAAAIKAARLTCIAPRPVAEAISAAGGVAFAGVGPDLMLNSLPGTFCAGEMLDWEAPTGGYLITACLATGRAAGRAAAAWMRGAPPPRSGGLP